MLRSLRKSLRHPMTLPELYEALERHDWFAGMSDDASVAQAGAQAFSKLVDEALALGAPGRQLWERYCLYKHSVAFGNGKLDKPKLEDFTP
jgi:hypothetical protein